MAVLRECGYDLHPSVVEGVCRFCECEPDGDAVSFLGTTRTRCNKPGCVIAFERWRDEQARAHLRRYVANTGFRRRRKSSRRAA